MTLNKKYYQLYTTLKLNNLFELSLKYTRLYVFYFLDSSNLAVLVLVVRSTEQLKYPSYFGTIFMLAGTFWMWVKCFLGDFQGISQMEPFKMNFPPMIGGYTYCIVCIASLVSGDIYIILIILMVRNCSKLTTH